MGAKTHCDRLYRPAALRNDFLCCGIAYIDRRDLNIEIALMKKVDIDIGRARSSKANDA